MSENGQGPDQRCFYAERIISEVLAEGGSKPLFPAELSILALLIRLGDVG